MAERRGERRGGEAERAGALSRWLRSIAAAGARTAARAPGAARLAPVRRSWLGSFWRARASVRAGIPLDDFLRSRLARHLAAIPVSRARLPLRIDVEDGQLAVRRVDTASPPPLDADDWLAPLEAVEGPDVRREAAALEARMTALEGEIDAARRRRDEISRRLAADVLAGNLAALPPPDATAAQLGRPQVSGPGSRAAVIAFVATALAAESWQVALPLLRGAGLDPERTGAEALRRPADAAFLCLLALGVAAGIFALSHAALGAGISLFRQEGADERRPSLAAGVLGAGLLACVVAWAVASLAARTGGEAGSALELALLLVAVPLSTALVLRVARRDAEQRAREVDAALAWDRTRARGLGERVRRFDELAWAEGEVRALGRERDLARGRLRDMSRRSLEAAHLAAEAEEREHAALARLAGSIVAALELDRYEFIRQASARAAVALVAPRLVTAAGRPHVPQEEDRREAGKGRLAS